MAECTEYVIREKNFVFFQMYLHLIVGHSGQNGCRENLEKVGERREVVLMQIGKRQQILKRLD